MSARPPESAVVACWWSDCVENGEINEMFEVSVWRVWTQLVQRDTYFQNLEESRDVYASVSGSKRIMRRMLSNIEKRPESISLSSWKFSKNMKYSEVRAEYSLPFVVYLNSVLYTYANEEITAQSVVQPEDFKQVLGVKGTDNVKSPNSETTMFGMRWEENKNRLLIVERLNKAVCDSGLFHQGQIPLGIFAQFAWRVERISNSAH